MPKKETITAQLITKEAEQQARDLANKIQFIFQEVAELDANINVDKSKVDKLLKGLEQLKDHAIDLVVGIDTAVIEQAEQKLLAIRDKDITVSVNQEGLGEISTKVKTTNQELSDLTEEDRNIIINSNSLDLFAERLKFLEDSERVAAEGAKALEEAYAHMSEEELKANEITKDHIKEMRKISDLSRKAKQDLNSLSKANKKAGGTREDLNKALRASDEAMKRTGRSSRSMGQAMSVGTQAIEGMQQGLDGVINNMPSLLQLLGAGANLATVIPAVASGIKLLWDAFSDGQSDAVQAITAISDELVLNEKQVKKVEKAVKAALQAYKKIEDSHKRRIQLLKQEQELEEKRRQDELVIDNKKGQLRLLEARATGNQEFIAQTEKEILIESIQAEAEAKLEGIKSQREAIDKASKELQGAEKRYRDRIVELSGQIGLSPQELKNNNKAVNQLELDLKVNAENALKSAKKSIEGITGTGLDDDFIETEAQKRIDYLEGALKGGDLELIVSALKELSDLLNNPLDYVDDKGFDEEYLEKIVVPNLSNENHFKASKSAAQRAVDAAEKRDALKSDSVALNEKLQPLLEERKKVEEDLAKLQESYLDNLLKMKNQLDLLNQQQETVQSESDIDLRIASLSGDEKIKKARQDRIKREQDELKRKTQEEARLARQQRDHEAEQRKAESQGKLTQGDYRQVGNRAVSLAKNLLPEEAAAIEHLENVIQGLADGDQGGEYQLLNRAIASLSKRVNRFNLGRKKERTELRQLAQKVEKLAQQFGNDK